MYCALCLFHISLLDKVFSDCFRQASFHLGDKKWLLVALDSVVIYTVMIIWGFPWVDSALVVLDEWLSCRGGRLNRCDCNALS